MFEIFATISSSPLEEKRVAETLDALKRCIAELELTSVVEVRNVRSGQVLEKEFYTAGSRLNHGRRKEI